MPRLYPKGNNSQDTVRKMKASLSRASRIYPLFYIFSFFCFLCTNTTQYFPDVSCPFAGEVRGQLHLIIRSSMHYKTLLSLQRTLMHFHHLLSMTVMQEEASTWHHGTLTDDVKQVGPDLQTARAHHMVM